jgi:DNA polymerase III subunit delta'|tara:strand:- start:37 stop:969 length:933 start_codon:yes stop_codon:yes gene_type:complete
MTLPIYFDAKKSINLYGLSENFKFLKKLYEKKKFPKVLMLSGKKGCGKSTLLNHLMFYIFDNDNYNEETNELSSQSVFHKQFIDNIFGNIIYLSGADFKNTKIEDIRNLKTKIFQTSILDKPRFIIFDDVELFNRNSLNALLKIIEEPSKNNFFLLIYNKAQPLLETIKSRCLDIQVILKEKNRQDIIGSLIKKFSITSEINLKTSKLTPGQFIKFNHIYDDNKISLEDDFLKNLGILLNLYKKNKDITFIDMVFFLTDNYFNKLLIENTFSNEKIVEYKSFVFENINKFFLYNLNQNALLNSIDNKINE